MHCPFCQEPDTRVIDSRLISDGAQIRRRRECVRCDERFTTFESAELLLPQVVKRDGRRSPFDEQKLRQGFLKALEKRPISTEQIEAAIKRIQHNLLACGEREVSSQLIGEYVMRELRALDEVAYIRFASVYRRFQDVKEFHTEIESLEKKPG